MSSLEDAIAKRTNEMVDGMGESGKTLMWKYLYNAPLNATETKEAKEYLASREIPNNRKLNGSVTRRWGNTESWDIPEKTCHISSKAMRDIDYSKIEKRIMEDVYGKDVLALQNVTINHGPTKKVMPPDLSAVASHNIEIKEGTYIVGTSIDLLNMGYEKPAEWPKGGITVIKDKEGNTFTVVPPEKATHMVYDKNGKSHWAKEDYEVEAVVDMESYDENGMYNGAVTGRAAHDKPNPLSFPHYTVTSESPVTMNIEIRSDEGVWISLGDSMKEASKAAKEWTDLYNKEFTVTGDIEVKFQDNTLFEEYCKNDVKLTEWMRNIVIIDEAHYHLNSDKEWFEEDCVECGDGYYDVNEDHSFACNSCSALPPNLTDWFDADCVHDDCDGHYDVDVDSCYCNAGNAPCSICSGDGNLICTDCGDYPPEDTKETASDVDGMWDALQDICRG